MKLLFLLAGADDGVDEGSAAEELDTDEGWDNGTAWESPGGAAEAGAGRPIADRRRTGPEDDADAVAAVTEGCEATFDDDGGGKRQWLPVGALCDEAEPSVMLLRLMRSLGEGKDMAGWGACTVMSRAVH